jgi:histidinol-phosphate/aromatic aminotransferase/cobyric acid decarboxylase-like protein
MGNNEYYEQVLRVIAALDTHELKALVLRDQKWYEIDDIQDKDIAETIFADTPTEKLKLTSRRFGGYWRFPKMLDFCYLVNPYFPTEQLRTEMRTYFDELMTEYPSGLNIQNLLTGKLFSVEPENILTGNGAAELIRALAPEIHGSIGVIYPTFNEYPESLSESGRIVPFYAETMTYTVEQVLDWQTQCDTLTLINTDNPSGNFLPARDVLKLLETMKNSGKRLILDESFVDFSDMEEHPGLLKQDILETYPNLIVVKSLSKSYGIAGLRLGVLACGDRQFIKNIRKHLPIWNINAFAEYFLQIVGKYAKEYHHACKALAQERRRFKAELEKTGLFEVYSSQANYFLCRCLGSLTAEVLAQHLLEEHNIFIKDLTGKKGISGTGWIRLAVRNTIDNDTLIAKLPPINFLYI